MQPTPVFLPGEESNGQRSLVGYSPRGRKESGTTEQLHFTSQETQKGLCINLEGWDGEGDGREVQNGGDICILTADSC